MWVKVWGDGDTLQHSQINFSLKIYRCIWQFKGKKMFFFIFVLFCSESFHMTVKEGQFTDSEIIVMLGENGTGKTTFIRMMAGLLKPDNDTQVPQLNVSYKPQKISPKSQGTVRMLMHAKIRDAYIHPQFITDVIKPLHIERIFDQEVQNLSGGELQRVALTLCLGKVCLYHLSVILLLLREFLFKCL